MRLLPCGTSAVLLEVDSLEEVLAVYAALVADRPRGVVDVVPGARTVLVVADISLTPLSALAEALRRLRPASASRPRGQLVEVPVTYDGADLGEVAAVLGCEAAEVVRRHTGEEWTVAFGGFAPGFAYLAPTGAGWDVPRRPTPRTPCRPGRWRWPAGSAGSTPVRPPAAGG